MNENKGDGFIGSLVSLKNIYTSIRTNKCKCIISNFEIEEGAKDELNKKMKEVKITEKKNDDKVVNTTLEQLIV